MTHHIATMSRTTAAKLNADVKWQIYQRDYAHTGKRMAEVMAEIDEAASKINFEQAVRMVTAPTVH